MPLLVLHAAIACVGLIAPRRATSIQQILTNCAIARANARWLAIAASAQQESSSHLSLSLDPWGLWRM
ncbi:hypothetical protein FXW78_20335 [Rhodococcus opacus]|nr:hypothetical protein [Rhodococcus opacus]